MQPFRTKELAMEFYRECKKLSIKDRTIRDQFERAVLSILLNICEGAGRINTRDRRKFYSISLGSLRETQCLAAHLYRLIQNPGGR